MEIKENILLANHTTFRIGGPAKYFVEAKNVEEIKEAVLWAREKSVPYFILGGGSNVLVSDEGFNGLVIKIKSSQFKIEDSKIVADAGVPLAKLVMESVNNNLTGLEWAVGIPGTIGGGVCGNCGAYGHSISESVIGGKMINQEGQIVEFNKNSCCFCYRGSAFKNNENKSIIIEVQLKLLNDESGKGREKIKEIILARSKKIPPFPSAGSFFKNYVVDKKNPENDPLLKKFPELNSVVRGGKVGVGYLIEQAGLKGRSAGGAKISEQHTNFIVNTGSTKASDVLELVALCRLTIKEKFGIEIEEEKIFLGF